MNTPQSAALAAHYSLALGLDEPWKVTGVTLDPLKKTLEIEVLHDDLKAACPECRERCSIHNLRERRSWRHVDMMQFMTTIHTEIPRTLCVTHGVKSVPVPWADAHSRFTLLFEHCAIEVLQATSSVSQARSLLRLAWDAIQRIKERAVGRGLARRDTNETIVHVGVDEKSFLKGHHYASLATDLDRGRVLDGVVSRRDFLWLTGARRVVDRCFNRPSLSVAAPYQTHHIVRTGECFLDLTVLLSLVGEEKYAGTRDDARVFLSASHECLECRDVTPREADRYLPSLLLSCMHTI